MSNFVKNKGPSDDKVRGGYYTPEPLAKFLCHWAIRSPSDKLIEPSCGDGNFVASAASLLGEDGLITAVEVVPQEIEKAKASTNGTHVLVDWRCASFFDIVPKLLDKQMYDVAIGNPPFIRFQYFDKRDRQQAFSLLGAYGYRPNGLSNAWVAFVQLVAELLTDGGRLAMVVPAELLQVKYAAELRYRLPMLFDDVYIVAFDELVFPHIQQEVVLLLAEGRRRFSGGLGKLHTIQAVNGDELVSEFDTSHLVPHLPERHTHREMKWTSLFLEENQFRVLNECADNPMLDRLGSLADVDVGVITGKNDFFVIDKELAGRLRADDQTLDVVGRTSALKSVRFTQADLVAFQESNRSKLLNLRGVDRASFAPPLMDYIKTGEEYGVHAGYKCRIRSRWFDVPSVYVPDAFLFRQIHKAPLLVANHCGATTTDTIHRVRTHTGVSTEALCACVVNSLTFAWSEVCGRSYGGGVLELEPSEAESLIVPYRFASGLDVDYIDGQLRAGNLDAALDHGDDILLRQGAGLSRKDVGHARSAWIRLQQRRLKRRRPTRATARDPVVGAKRSPMNDTGTRA